MRLRLDVIMSCARRNESVTFRPVTRMLPICDPVFPLQGHLTRLTRWLPELKVIVLPQLDHTVNKVAHHFRGVVGRGCDSKHLLTPPYCRVVDRLDVYSAVI